VAELTTAIDDYIAHNNAHPKPFIWTKSAHDIILKVNRGRAPWAGLRCYLQLIVKLCVRH
jgi:hypothetical protein